ncbi:MAG: MFS transporter [Pseudomonadales bacterium]
MNRNLILLMASQCMVTAGTVLVVTIGGIVGTALAPEAALATVPMSLMVVGTAMTAVPAALLMRRIGRRRGFSLAALAAVGAALLGAGALWLESFVLFCLATLLIGAKVAFSQQYRFAAAESVAPTAAGRAVSLVLLGAVGGAFIGPELATRAAALVDGVEFAGSFLALAVVFVVATGLLYLMVEPVVAAAPEVELPRRPLRAIARQPLFVIAVLGGVVGQGVMTFVMTATPISMHVLDGFTLAETAGVIRAHVLAMYVPSLASALLIGWLGIGRLMGLGLGMFVATLVIALQGHEYLHYWGSLLLLGIGWNFLFVGGTSLLVQSYRPEERFTAQAANDFCVFGVAALGSLLAGSVVHVVGWEGVLWGSLPLLAVMAGALAWLALLRRSDGPRAKAV